MRHMPSSFRRALGALIVGSGLLLILLVAVQFFPSVASPFRRIPQGQARQTSTAVMTEADTIDDDPFSEAVPAAHADDPFFSGSAISSRDDVLPDAPAELNAGRSQTIEVTTASEPEFEADAVPLPPMDDDAGYASSAETIEELQRLERRIGELERRVSQSRAAGSPPDSQLESRVTKLIEQLQAQSRELKVAVGRVEQVEHQLVTSSPVVKATAAVDAPAAPRLSIRSVNVDGEAKWVLQARDASLPELFARLGESTGMNLLVSPDVTGTASLHLMVPSGEIALEALCKIYHCRSEQTGNFLVISRDAQLTTQTTMKPAGPETITKLYRLKHLSGAEIRPFIQPLLTPGLGTVSFATIRERVARTTYRDPPRAILVKDLPSVLADVDRLMIELDQPPAYGMALPKAGEPLRDSAQLPDRVQTTPTLPIRYVESVPVVAPYSSPVLLPPPPAPPAELPTLDEASSPVELPEIDSNAEIFDPPTTSSNPVRSRRD